MKILMISRNAWDDTNSIGNTASNFFGGMENVEFASIYFRGSDPNNSICTRYYRTTEKEVLKKWFSPERIGKTFSWKQAEAPLQPSKEEKKERALVRWIQKHDLKLAYKLSDSIWYSKKWINGNLRSFIADFAPDLVVSFVKAAPQYYLTVRYLREQFRIPVLALVADDEYTGYAKKHARREISNLAYILKEAAAVRGFSQELCDYYNSVFSCHAQPIYKGCDLSAPLKTQVGDPVKLVYAGNLLYGRLDMIEKIAEAVERCAGNGKNICFQIYSNTQLAPEEERRFQDKRCTQYLGRRDYAFIRQQLQEADVVIHAESFEQEQILKTRYSFSTKIIDCLQSGSVLLAVGPKGLASVEYVRRIPGAQVVDDPEQLEEQLQAFLADSGSFCSRAEQIRTFAREHHDKKANLENLQNTLKTLIGEES